MGHYRTIPINRITKWPMTKVDLRPCRVPEDDFLKLMAENAPLAPVEPRAAASPYCERCRYNELWSTGVATLSVLASVGIAVLCLWRR